MLLEARVTIEVEVRLETGVGDRLETGVEARLETGVEARLGDTTGAKIEEEGEARLVEEGEDIKFGAEDFLCARVKGFLIIHAAKRFLVNLWLQYGVLIFHRASHNSRSDLKHCSV